ncbi:MAG: thymidine phosphorylase [Gemmatimonas sp.]
MLAIRLIEKKRDGGRIEPGEWRALLGAYMTGHVPDYQMAAFLMAAYLRGLDRDEAVALTESMLRSGSALDLHTMTAPRIDKHSTGGVGDKVSLVLAPLAAAVGIVVPMVSGRGLGHTGGTLDKLDAIPGFRSDLTLTQARTQLERIGCVLLGQTSELAPADRRLYALRDATATVESIPLLAASIMSKKLAEGLTGLVLDVKRGSGSFFQALEREVELAQLMIALGAAHGCPVVSLMTAMDRPLGRACGSALETEEAIHALHGEGPPDLMEVTYALGAEMMMLGAMVDDRATARDRLESAIASGAAADKLKEIIEAQGGNPAVVDDPALMPQAEAIELFRASRRGFVAQIEPRAVGRGITSLGGGRTTMADTIDPAVGFVITAKPGDWVESGEAIASVFARDEAGLRAGAAALREAIRIADEAEPPLPLISHRVTAQGVEVYAQ